MSFLTGLINLRKYWNQACAKPTLPYTLTVHLYHVHNKFYFFLLTESNVDFRQPNRRAFEITFKCNLSPYVSEWMSWVMSFRWPQPLLKLIFGWLLKHVCTSHLMVQHNNPKKIRRRSETSHPGLWKWTRELAFMTLPPGGSGKADKGTDKVCDCNCDRRGDENTWKFYGRHEWKPPKHLKKHVGRQAFQLSGNVTFSV